MSVMVILSSMVVDQLDIDRFTKVEAEDDTPVAGHRAPVVRETALQRVESKQGLASWRTPA